MKRTDIDCILYAVYVTAAVMIAVLAYLIKDTPAASDLVQPEIEKVYEVKIAEPALAESEIVFEAKTAELVADAEPEPIPTPAVMITEGELELLAGVIHAEAGNQDETGKRLVADVVLNRVDDKRFPDSITGVIRQAGQFTEPAGYTEADMIAAQKAIEERLDAGVLWFRTGKYHKYGTPLYQHGAHYFSGVEQ